MNFKNILKLSSFVFLASQVVAETTEFRRDCEDLNKFLVDNTKNYLRENEHIEDVPPIKSCDYAKNGDITDLYLVSKRIDQPAIEQALNRESIYRLTYLLDNDFYQREPAVYDDFPASIASLPNLLDLTLKYNEEIFVRGDNLLAEREIKPEVLNLTSDKIKSITLDHIKITKELVDQISKLNTLEYLVVYSGSDNFGKNTNKNDYKLLKNLKNISTLTLDGKTYNTENGKIITNYFGKCLETEIALRKNIIDNLNDYESLSVFTPLKECKTNSKGKITELSLDSARNGPTPIQEILSNTNITKLTYTIDDGFYQHEPAVYGDVPYEIAGLPNLKEFTLKYNYEVFEHGDYLFFEKEINSEALKLTSKKLKTLTLDHIKITKDLVKQLGKLKTLKNLVIISADRADKKYYNNLKSLKNISSLTIDGEKVL